MNGSHSKPFPAEFYCERLGYVTGRIQCVLRQQQAWDRVAVERYEVDGVSIVPEELASHPCLGCEVGQIQKQIQRMEGEKERSDNGNL